MKIIKKHIACIVAACLLLTAVGVSAAIAQTSGKKQPMVAKPASTNSFAAAAKTDTSSIAAISSSVTGKAQAPSLASVQNRLSVGKAGNGTQTSSSAHPAAVRRQSAVSKETTGMLEAVKTITIQGKSYKAKFVETKSTNANIKASNVKPSKLNVYRSEDGSEFKYDNETGKLINIFISQNNPQRHNKELTREQDITIGQEFIKSQKELSYLKNKMSDYTLESCETHDNISMITCDLVYSKHILGYSTSEGFALSFDSDGQLISFSYKPGYFENVKLPTKFDESPYLAKLNSQLQSMCKNHTLPEYIIDSRGLYVSNSNELGMSYLIMFKPKNGSKQIDSMYGFDITLN